MKSFLEFFKENDIANRLKGMKLYHGSNVEFDVFDFEKFGQTDSGTMGPGFYLTGIKEEAQRYAENAVRYRQSGEPHVLVFEVFPQKTLHLDSNNASTWEDKMRQLGITPSTHHENASEIMKLGYDSIVVVGNEGIREMLLMLPGISRRVG